jgi:hypothetical protein
VEVGEVPREAKVGDLDDGGGGVAGGEEEVVRLEVAVDHVVAPEELEAAAQLAREALGVDLQEAERGGARRGEAERGGARRSEAGAQAR